MYHLLTIHSGGDICLKCWDFIRIAMKIIDSALQGKSIHYDHLMKLKYSIEDFGFKYRLWVYSGRRGVHCWVCDPRARKLNDQARRAIVSWLEVIKVR
jgi:DNA primase small subunit